MYNTIIVQDSAGLKPENYGRRAEAN